MKTISKRNIIIGFILAIVIVVSFVGGLSERPLFIITAIAIVAFIILHRNKLCCPHCGGFENLDRLIYAIHHEYHCSHCGERIAISE
jgi:hypothetical protein